MKIKYSKVAVGMLAGAVLSVASVAQAVPLGALSSCVGDNYDLSGNATPNIGCGIDFNNFQDFFNAPQGETVNEGAGYFNITSWLYDGKLDLPWTDDSGLVNFTPQQSGTWTIDSSAWDQVSDLMLVFKGGPSAGTYGLVAYLITPNSLAGSFETPFVTPPFQNPGGEGGPFDVSHISVYYTPAQEVPEPALSALLALGLLGLGLMARRRRS